MIRVRLYSNGDDCFLVWSMPPTPNCWGFALHRDLTTAGGKQFSGFLHNRIGFDGDDNPPHTHKPSTEWPFQRYTWTDHGVGQGDTVCYTISPVMKTANGLAVDATDQRRQARHLVPYVRTGRQRPAAGGPGPAFAGRRKRE